MKLDKKKLNRYQSANDLQFVINGLSQTPRNFSKLTKFKDSPIKQEEQNKDIIKPIQPKKLKLQRRLASHQNLTTLRGVNRALVKQESVGNISANSSLLADAGDEDLALSKRKSDKISSIH